MLFYTSEEKKKKLISSIEENLLFHKATIKPLETVAKITAPYDGKVVNKKFVALVETASKDISASLLKNYCDYLGFEIYFKSERNTDIFYCIDCFDNEKGFLEVGKRFNHKKFLKLIDDAINEHKKSIEELEQDLKDGLERLESYQKKLDELEELAKSFNYSTRKKIKNLCMFNSPIWTLYNQR